MHGQLQIFWTCPGNRVSCHDLAFVLSSLSPPHPDIAVTIYSLDASIPAMASATWNPSDFLARVEAVIRLRSSSLLS